MHVTTYWVKGLYSVGVTCGYILQLLPLFNLFDKYILKADFEQ